MVCGCKIINVTYDRGLTNTHFLLIVLTLTVPYLAVSLKLVTLGGVPHAMNNLYL